MWTYEGYWNVVIGADRRPDEAVVEFDLVGKTAEEIEEWLASSEEEAWQAGKGADDPDEIPDEWEDLRARAARDLHAATNQCDRCGGAAKYWSCCGDPVDGSSGTGCQHEDGERLCASCWDEAVESGEVTE